MLQYLGTDFALDLVKGLVVGGASLALQALVPRTLRALRRLRARLSARKPARKPGRAE
jgi:HAMP domain-containing protein